MVKLEIIVRPEHAEEVRDEFQHFLERARHEGWVELKVLFGFPWGNHIYLGNWTEETMTPKVLAERVAAAELKREGIIGSADLFVTPVALGVQYTFCHEADIHLEGPEDSEYIASEAKRFESLGWTLHRRTKMANQPLEADGERPMC